MLKSHNVGIWHLQSLHRINSYSGVIPTLPSPAHSLTWRKAPFILFSYWVYLHLHHLLCVIHESHLSSPVMQLECALNSICLFIDKFIFIPQRPGSFPNQPLWKLSTISPLWQVADSDGMRSNHFSPTRVTPNSRCQSCSCHWEVCSMTVWRKVTKSDSVFKVFPKTYDRFSLKDYRELVR